MSRWTDADDALELLNLMYDNQEDKDDPYNVGVMGAINYIKHKAPSIEICFCRECKYDGTWKCPWRNTQVPRYPSADDFCSRGERKGE